MYVFISWLFSYIFMFIYSKKLIYIFMYVLSFKNDIHFMILDSQTFMITCLQFVFFFVNLFYFPLFIYFIFLFGLNIISKKERSIYLYLFVCMFFIFFLSYWTVDQDLGFSFWEFFDYDFFKVFMIFDYKPSFELVLYYFINEYYDFFILTFFLNLIFIFSLKSFSFVNLLKKFRFFFYFFIIIISFYFFFGEGVIQDLYLFIFILFFLEFFFFTIYFFKNISKKI